MTLHTTGKFFVGALAALAYVWSFGVAFTMLNAPSDLSVAVGFTLGVALVVSLLVVIPKYLRWVGLSGGDALWPVVLLLALTGCGKIDPGHVGIKVNNWGSDRGVVGAEVTYDKDGAPVMPDNATIVTGGYFYNPFTSSVYEYPTFTQRAAWVREKDGKNEEVCYNSREGMVFCADITFAYQLDGRLVPAFYVKYRTDQLEAYTHGILRDIARDAMNEEGPSYTAEELYGEKKEEFLNRAKARVNARLGKYGVIISNFGYGAPPRPPDAIVHAINGKIKAIQDAQRVENELREERAKAAKTIAQAQGGRVGRDRVGEGQGDS